MENSWHSPVQHNNALFQCGRICGIYPGSLYSLNQLVLISSRNSLLRLCRTYTRYEANNEKCSLPKALCKFFNRFCWKRWLWGGNIHQLPPDSDLNYTHTPMFHCDCWKLRRSWYLMLVHCVSVGRCHHRHSPTDFPNIPPLHLFALQCMNNLLMHWTVLWKCQWPPCLLT